MARPVLLIDDDHAFSQSLLGRYHASPVLDWADSWERGLDLFRIGRHELVLADYNLPGSERGLKLLLRIKPLRPSSRLVLISGALMREAERLVSSSGVIDRYLSKFDARFADEVDDEIQGAMRRSGEATDWQRVGEAYMKSEAVDRNTVEKIDQALHEQIDQKSK